MAERANPRLVDQDSPYLEEAAHQPVDWHPWSEAAFKKAQKEDKPVLVDSGAVWCHWCHVMDHESYEDPETAALINEHFVPIKLDRDERPDIDKDLQQAVGAITGRGGWPLTAFLTPDGDVFYGGTYFPREAQRGMPAFKDLLQRVSTFWRDQRDDAIEQAHKLQQALTQATSTEPASLTFDRVKDAIDQALGAYDAAHGGFGSQPKFPHATTIDLLFAYARHGNDERANHATTAAFHTLEAMHQGGIFDHLAGGFHRYSVDANWHVPHFEKMLYDNAQLLNTYATALAETNDPERAPALERAATGTIRFLRDVLEQPQGGFGGSQDADRRPETADGPLDKEDLDDGGYFTWTQDEIHEHLPDELAKTAILHFGITDQGDMPDEPGQNVLRIDATPEDIAEGTHQDANQVRAQIDEIQTQLLEARREREPPFTDPTVYTDWNGLAITALLRYDQLHGVPEARTAALNALNQILDHAYDPDDGVYHALSNKDARVTDLVDDHVQLLPALIEAYHATLDPTHLDHATQIADHLLDRFQRNDGQLRFNATREDPVPQGDQPTPSPGAQAALHLPRLARLTGNESYKEAAKNLLEALASKSNKLGGVHGGTLHQALLYHLREPPHIVLTGSHDEGAPFLATIRSIPTPGSTFTKASTPQDPGVPDEAREAAKAFSDAVAIVCQDQACHVADTPEELASLLTAFPIRG